MLVITNIMLLLSFASDNFRYWYYTNKCRNGPENLKILIRKTISESYLYPSGRKTNEKMTNKKRFRHKSKPTTKTSIYIF